MQSFFYSFILVLIAQIPLLLKIYFEYKQNISDFKLELYRKQLDYYIILSGKISSVQKNNDILFEMYKDGSLDYDQKNIDIKNMSIEWLNEINELQKYAMSNNLLLTADMVVDTEEYSKFSSMLITRGVLKIKLSNEKHSIDEIYENQLKLFNKIFNKIRLIIGTDQLSEHNTYQISNIIAKPQKIILQKYENTS